MANNLFEELRAKKDTLIQQTHKAKEFGWIDADREMEFIDKINNDILTIGVIGQMKCGKSTFLNAFVFQDTVLPAATTPMTAALSVITYGPEKKVKAEFYTVDEWAEQKLQAARSLEEVQGNSLEESKVKAAKELVGKAAKLGSSIYDYLGKTQEDRLDQLEEYVGADGKFVSITKSVTIFYPEEYLKGVEIVDTPGFNDPIVSREERTKAFLKKADVVILMLYAGRPFDATDRDILFKNVRQCGIGKVLIGINKYDIPFANGEYEDEIKNYVVEQIQNACRDCDDNTLTDILKESHPIPLSAEMALLSELPMSRINSNDVFQTAWKRHCENFGIGSQQELANLSHLANLTSAVKEVVEREKEQILIAKPQNALKAAGDKVKADMENKLRECKSLIENLSVPEDELEEKQQKLAKAERKLNRKIDSLEADIEETMKKIVRMGGNAMEDDVDSCVKELNRTIDQASRWDNPQTTIIKMEAKIQTLSTRTLKRRVQSIGDEAKLKVIGCATDFFTDVSDVLRRYVSDVDLKDFEKDLRKQVEFEIKDGDMFKADTAGNEEDWLDILGGFFNGATFGALGKVIDVINFSSNKKEWLQYANSLKTNFDPKPYLDTCFQTKDAVIASIKKKLIDDFVDPLKKQIDEILQHFSDKEAKLKEAESNLVELEKQRKAIEEQIAQFNA